MKQDIFFMSGFPRAGSTLLMQILGQNPRFHPTPTSGLVASVVESRNSWRQNENYVATPEDYIYSHIKTMLRGMIYGFYDEEIQDNKIPIDKNRAWTGQMDLLDDLLDTKVRFIYPIRHVVDCLISFERIRRKSGININPHQNKQPLKSRTTVGRAELYLGEDDVLGAPIQALREIIGRGDYDRLLLVPFDDLLRYPEATVKRLYYQMEIDYYPHDFNNLKQITTEYDVFHFSAPNALHRIKEGGIRLPNDRDLTIFNENIINEIENQKYRDISDFINANTGVF